MGTDNFHLKRKNARKERRAQEEKLKPDNWLIVCEGEKTEPNYFKKVIEEANKKLPSDSQIKAKIEGIGSSTISLVKTAEELEVLVDKYNKPIIPYGKIFVVFDKDSFKNQQFNDAIQMCEKNGFIALWSNQAIEYWFLLHFNHHDRQIHRTEYEDLLNKEFKNKGSEYRYQKNSEETYEELEKNGSLDEARKRAKRIHENFINSSESPAKSESCTIIYQFFDILDEKIQELE